MAPNMSSPQSSFEGSFGGTPDTRITAFSPEDVRYGKQASHHGAVTPQKSAPHDPFVSTERKPKLSASAPTFQPGSSRIQIPVADNRPLPGTAEHLNNIISAAENESTLHELTSYGTFTTTTVKTRNLKITSLRGVSLDVMSAVDRALQRVKCKGTRRVAGAGNAVLLRLAHIEDVPVVYNALQATEQLAIEYISPSVFALVVSPTPLAKQSAHEGQVVMRVQNAANVRLLSRPEFEHRLLNLLTAQGTVCAYRKVPDGNNFHLVAEFADVSDASTAISRLNGMTIGEGLYTISVTAYQPDIASAVTQRLHTSDATTPTRRPQNDLSSAMSNLSVGAGLVGAFDSVPGTQGTTPLGFAQGNGLMHPHVAPNVGMYAPVNAVQGYYLPPMPGLPLSGVNPYSTPLVAYIPQQAIDPAFLALQQGFRPFNALPSDMYGHRSLVRRHNAVKIPNSRHRGHLNNSHNTVIIDRIKNGSDVRTTVMLRNIPNKMDQIGLKTIVDESSFGRYDFMYLRIDFSNNCNVGYAFLNFVDPIDILGFVSARAGNNWPGYRSDKVAEVSYATIQGKDCLVQKFRNSSVMLEPPTHRPKLFVTFHDVPVASIEDVGKEEEFPASDNPAKLKRSCENAEHVGLFAPSAGQHMRDEQRRRRSQFDRGTSLAEREEDFEYDPYLDF